MLLNPHKSAEEKVFSEPSMTLSEFVEVGQHIGMQEAVYAYMDEAVKSGKTITSLSEEIAASYSKNPAATSEAVKVIGNGTIIMEEDDAHFTFCPEIVHSDITTNNQMAFMAYTRSSEGRTLLSFIPNTSEQAIEQITETSIAQIHTEPDIMIARSDGIAKLNESGIVYDTAESTCYYNEQGEAVSGVETYRDIVLKDGRSLYIDQSEIGHTSHIVEIAPDGTQRESWLDGDVDIKNADSETLVALNDAYHDPSPVYNEIEESDYLPTDEEIALEESGVND